MSNSLVSKIFSGNRLLYYICVWASLASCHNSSPFQFVSNADDTEKINSLLKNADTNLNYDSALHFAKKAYELSLKIDDVRWLGKSLITLANARFNIGEKPQADSTIQKAINTLNKGKYYNELGDAYNALAVIQNPDNDSPAENKYHSEEYYKYMAYIDSTALHYYELSGNKEKQANTILNIGQRKEIEGDFTGSLIQLKKAQAIYESIHYSSMYKVYYHLGGVYALTGDYQQGVKYSYLAVQLAEAAPDTTALMGEIYNGHAVVLARLNQNDSTMLYYKKALKIAEKLHDPNTLIIKINIASIYWDFQQYDEGLKALNDIDISHASLEEIVYYKYIYVEIYLATKQFTKALAYVNDLIDANKLLADGNYVRSYCQIPVAQYYLATGQFQKVYPLAYSYISYSKKSGNHFEISRGYKWLFKADSSLGKYTSAISNYQLYTSYKDSVFNENKSKQIEQVKASYETEKKEQKIELLTKQAELKQIQLVQVKNSRSIIIGGTVMLLLLLGVSYNRYRLKQRSNKQLQIKQEEINNKNEDLERFLKEKEWLVKEIHHRVKNNLQVIMSLLNTQSLYLDNEIAIRAIRESQSRMHAMSLIHQTLYQTDNVSTVNIQSYVHELIHYLRDSYQTNARIISDDIADINLDVAQAIPVGLILNEAITNAIKYAVRDSNTGIIKVSIVINDDNNILMRIADNGLGLSPDYDINKNSSLGISLMKGLTGQLGGTFTIKNENGLTIEVVFAYLNTI